MRAPCFVRGIVMYGANSFSHCFKIRGVTFTFFAASRRVYDFISLCPSFLYQNVYMLISKQIVYFPADLQNITKEVEDGEKYQKNVENSRE